MITDGIERVNFEPPNVTILDSCLKLVPFVLYNKTSGTGEFQDMIFVILDHNMKPIKNSIRPLGERAISVQVV